jgi:hypothetical protein
MDRVIRAFAMVCLALALAGALASVRSTLDAGAIEGPSGLIVTRGPLPRQVWLGVDDELWRLTPDGRLIDRQPIAASGLPRPPANLVHGPDGTVVASVRRDPTLYVIDAQQARVVRRLLPQWPDDLARHGGRAINFAFDAQGRVAIATGGGDAVALFDADGRFIARTPPGAYAFTNGLWWSDQGLWTTDTNRFTLRLLDGGTLAPQRTVELGHDGAGGYLGPARGHPHPRTDGPQAALIRFRGDMIRGTVARVDSGGRATTLPHAATTMKPRDLDWLDGDLLVTDGVSFSILRWSAQGLALAPFGDAAVQSALEDKRRERDALHQQRQIWLGVAGVALALGLAGAAAAAWLARREQPRRPLDLSRLGTARLPRLQLFKLTLRMNRWIIVMLLPMMALQLLGVLVAANATLKALVAAQGPWVAVATSGALLLIVLATFPLALRRIRRLSALPEYEPVANQLAMAQLQRSAGLIASELRAGEQVLEAFHLRPGLTWWVLTSERLLGYPLSLGQARAKASHELADATRIAEAPAQPPAAIKRWALALDVRAGIDFEFGGGGEHRVGGGVGSPVLAARIRERAQQHAERMRRLRRQRPHDAPTPRPSTLSRRRRAAWSSLLLPGVGHWQLGHGAQAIVFLVPWLATVVLFTAPTLWTLAEPFTAVSHGTWIGLGLWHAALSGMAAADAWRLEPASPGA